MADLRLVVNRERTRDFWYHGFNNYMQYGTHPHISYISCEMSNIYRTAFPMDEVFFSLPIQAVAQIVMHVLAGTTFL